MFSSLFSSLNQSAFNIGNASGAYFAGLPIAMGYGYTSADWVGTAMAGTGILLAGIIILSSGILLMQPDTGTVVVIVAALGSIYLVAGGTWRHIGLSVLVGVIALGLLVSVRPYVKERLVTFINPTSDPTRQPSPEPTPEPTPAPTPSPTPSPVSIQTTAEPTR